MNGREFELLVQAAIEGEASREEIALLEAALRGSRERRALFRKSFLLHQRLSSELGAGGGSGEARPRPATVEEILQRQRSKILRSSWLAAAAVLLLLAGGMRLIWTHANPPMLSYEVAPNTDFAVVGGDPSHPRLEPGTRVKIRQGSMKLEFGAGVSGMVLGPAEFTLKGPLELLMSRGTARFRVEEKARGFKVVSPRVEVVDLGTEFGLTTDGDALPQVHVFEGRVSASAQRGVQETRVIRAGEAFEVSEQGEFGRVPLEPGKFLKSLPEDLPYVWIPFEAGKAGELIARGTHPVADEMKLEIDPRGGSLVAGWEGDGFEFPGKATPVRTNWMGVRGDAPRTIALWVKPDPRADFRRFRSLITWGRQKRSASTMCELLLSSEGPGEPVRLCFAFNNVFYVGSQTLADGNWHHVAVVFRGGEVRPGEAITTLYVDGKREDLASSVLREPFAGWTPDFEGELASPLLIGSVARPGFDNGFKGRMDELFIFEAALDDARIRQLSGE
ncbi:ferric-dicitrate binding protein FerR (iron transport regulator) [Haloferula luteola]|uniref:Ferric-dicitrate binding protein FerR (Iron transport regulator) n=1 Tax=Haloferula luteola TaxID=595692 RepID=A0A840VF68_9BACT|nr:LamG-like jellyroll fold domain-containing protein [Haloferula luteola]MBB5352460.1 ferric-dicitrate binding protein FerR (iron transport regulator) [Haloferula luteola]